ncbi:MAG: ABC transporter permease [Anaerovoracaceae bacterium]|nr:ABC transporter permease [Anaerovoracaceae bacterium]
MSKLNKEPLLHITKRKELPMKKTWAIRIGAILAALIVCAIVTMLLTGLDPFSVFGTLIYGAIGTERKTLIVLKELALLLCVALALTPAFKMKFWNLGAEGQILMGAWATALCMIYMGDTIPSWLLIIICLVAAIICGAIWAMIPAFFKAKWNTNETLFTLMMNYVAIQLVAYFIILWEVPKGSGNVGIINQSTMAGWLPYIGTNSYILVIIFVAIITAAMYVYLKYSKHGYEISVVGESQKTALYVGIKVDRVIIRTLLLSGAICGFTGWMMVSGIDHTITTTLAGGRGFLGIMVSWLAQFNVIAMIFASLLIVFLEQGAGEISTIFGLNESFADILTGIILFFIIGCEFFINYKVHIRKKSGKEEA